MSLLAQIGTAPLVAFYFGRLPVCSLLTGLVVIPAATAIIYLAVALFAVGFVPVLQQAVATVLAFVATWLNAFLLAMASQPWASVGLPRLSPLQVVLLYVVAVCVCRLLAIAAGAWSRQESGGRDMLLPTVAVGNSPIAAAVRRPGSCVPAHGLSVCAILRSFYRSLKLL